MHEIHNIVKLKDLPANDVYQVNLTNDSGTIVGLLNYGGLIRSIEVPDRMGTSENVLLGHIYHRDYWGPQNYPVGTLALTGTGFTSDRRSGVEVEALERALEKVRYECKYTCWTMNHISNSFLELSRVVWCRWNEKTLSVRLRIAVTLTPENELKLCYSSESELPVFIDLKNCCAFNLSALRGPLANNHLLIRTIDPLGKGSSQGNTVGDLQHLNKSGPIGNRNLDHWVFSGDTSTNLHMKGKLHCPASGRNLELFSTLPGLRIKTLVLPQEKNGNPQHTENLDSALILFPLNTRNEKQATDQGINRYAETTVYHFFNSR